MWIGRMRTRIATGPRCGCRPKQNGRKRHGGRMGGYIRGAMICPLRYGRTMRKRTGTSRRRWYRWEHWKMVRVPMASMIWPGMPGNGSATGMTTSITRTVRRRTRRDRNEVTSKCCGAARGTAGRSPSIPRIGTTAHRSTTGATTTGFGARKLRSLWSFDPWVLALRPKDSEIPRSHEEAGEPSRVNRRR